MYLATNPPYEKPNTAISLFFNFGFFLIVLHAFIDYDSKVPNNVVGMHTTSTL